MNPDLYYYEKLYVDGETFFDTLLKHIATARESIELESYIFDLDHLGEKFVKALIESGKKGLRVRVLVDGIGSSEYAEEIAHQLSGAGVEVKIYHPLPWQINHYKWSIKQGSLTDRLVHFVARINRRDHRKLCIIDGKELWAGSFNISASHLRVENGGGGWRDFGVCVSGGLVQQVVHTFEALWHRQTRGIRRNSFKRFLSNLSSSSRRAKNSFLINKISCAKSRIWIASAYFAPSSSVIRVIGGACSRGVDVRLLVPSKSDVFFFPFLTASYYADLLRMGVNVYEYTPGFLHAKAMISDDFYLVGSSNFNHRSFLHDLELDIVLKTEEARKLLESQFTSIINQSQQVTLNQVGLRAWLIKLVAMPRFLRYWM